MKKSTPRLLRRRIGAVAGYSFLLMLTLSWAAFITGCASTQPQALPKYGVSESDQVDPPKICQELRVNCAMNLKQIGLAVRMYASDHDGCYPESLLQLLKEDYLFDTAEYDSPDMEPRSPQSFCICPATDTKPAKDLTEFGSGDHCDYEYIGAGLREEDLKRPLSDVIILCDKFSNHRRIVDDGYINVLFADGHIKGFLNVESIEQLAERHGLYLPKERP